MSIKIDRLLSRAKKLNKKGQFKEAKKIYQDILESFPSNKEAKIGLLELNQNKETKPNKNQLEALVDLHKTGEFQKALFVIDDLIKTYDNDPFLFNIKGSCLCETGDLNNSIISFEKAITLKPDYAEALFNLGVAYQKLNQSDMAIETYEKALVSQHAYPAAHHNLGIIYFNKNRLSSAIKSFEWAVAYSPNYSEAYYSLGSAFQQNRQFQEAKKHFEKAISVNPNYAQAYESLGILCEIINLRNEAVGYFEKALTINPHLTNTYRNLSKLKKFKANDPLISQMESLYSKSDLHSSHKINLCFSLATAYEDLNHQDNFFKFLNEGNALRKKELGYDIIQSQNVHSTIVNLFSSKQSLINNPKEKPSIRPIFIVGMPRSGTSLVEQIISSHHEVYGAGELLTLRKVIDPILVKYLNNNKYKVTKKDYLLIREQYLDSLSNLNVSNKIITDKMPVNFRLIGFILSAMPEAKIIHIKRDARATCWSNYQQYFTDGNGFSFDQEDLVKFYSLYSEMMGFWHKLFPNKIYDISYEELTNNQKKETQKLLNYCELDWDENCLKFHKNVRGVVTASKAQVRKKMYQGSSEAWKKYESNLKTLTEGLKSY
ncbi:sulfotransferase [Candidatus Pseudothioglobus singularis]|nr:tetratricopeptide repeat-containing sulfotransferase family protein [Candidatus Pseudothioglobus singularis]MDB4597956.1 sulfotransferase [Candidatus Pseudothioglobus singularis]